MIRPSCFISVLLLSACSAPPPPTPSLLPETAAQLLQYNNKAKDWLTYVKKHDPSCEYKLDLPDQSAHPTEIDLDHIMYCGNRPGPKEYDASVQFVYDKAAQHWVILRFSS
ncbi:MAG: hypothetical protein JOY62_16025 [Acidobacteriaceae bacterium]|nr:hypothetical protein [Acidobacteriaceae bacterium]MBV9781471.1 hypothetical protein [Acidobacteriaceae bacterium]